MCLNCYALQVAFRVYGCIINDFLAMNEMTVLRILVMNYLSDAKELDSKIKRTVTSIEINKIINIHTIVVACL